MNDKTPYPLYFVIWKDHTGDSSWKTVEEIKKDKPILAYTIGYLIHKDKESIKIANTYTSDKGYGGTDLILKNCIIEMYELEILD